MNPCIRCIVFYVWALACLAGVVNAAPIAHHPGYEVRGIYGSPAGVGDPLGGLYIEADGSTFWIMSDSEDIDANARTGVVSRGIDGHINGFGSTTMQWASPYADLGFIRHPDTDTQFYSAWIDPDLTIEQRASGSIFFTTPITEQTYAGLEFLTTPSGTDLLVSLYDINEIWRYSLTPNVGPSAAGTFSLTFEEVWADLSGTGWGIGDLAWMTAGPLAGQLAVAAWDSDEVHTLAVDPTTGAYLGGSNLLGSGFKQPGAGAWGMAVDPETGDLFVTAWDVAGGGTITQISIPEPASLALIALGTLTLAARRR